MQIAPFWSRAALCTLVGGSGMLHLVVPTPYRRIIPKPLRPWAGPLVYWSGIAELTCSALMVFPRTRRFGATSTAILLIAVFPANVQMVLDATGAGSRYSRIWLAVAWLRLPLQVPLVRWAWGLRTR